MGAPTHHHPGDDRLPPPELQEVSDGVFAYVQPDGSWWINNTGFLVGASGGASGVVGIDTCSTERRTRAFLDAIATVTPDQVTTLVNTHHHGDHTNGNCLLPGSTIIGHHRCREALLGSPIAAVAALFEPVEWGELQLSPPFVTFEDRLDVYVDDLRVELHYIGGPAHTVGDVLAWVPERSVLFAGDLVFNGGTPFVLMGSVTGSLAAVERLRSFGAQTLVPGHGAVCGSDALDAMAGYLGWIQQTAAAAKSAGLGPLAAARDADLGPYADLLDSERLVGNLYRAYAEIDGAAPGAAIDLAAAFTDMIAFNGGRPLRCLA
jgi:cyclase